MGPTDTPIEEIFHSSTRATPLPLTHKETYPAISSSHNPSLSQAGKTILITGGGAGVGFMIAKQFAKAGASRLILLGRRQDVLERAAAELKNENSEGLKSVHVRPLDVTDRASVASLWDWIAKENINVDVLVLGHGRPAPIRSVLNVGPELVREMFEVNVLAFIDLMAGFWKHLNSKRPVASQEPSSGNGPAVVINVSTAGIWDYVACGPVPVYSLTKNSGTLFLQQIAKDVDPEKLRMVSYHPGLLKTDGTKDVFPPGFEVPWDTPELAGDFAVWLASPEAGFLHGRFVHSSWDVEDLCEGGMREKIEADPFFLKVGVLGFHP